MPNKEYREQHLEQIREYNRNWERTHPEIRKKAVAKQKAKGPLKFLEMHREARRRYYRANKKKHVAGLQARRKIPLDSKCSQCGATEKLQRHHPDYAKPLEVVTLCMTCHKKLHRKECLLANEA